MSTKQAAVASIDSLLRQIASANEKRAAADSEPGGYTGETSHPSKDVDDGLMTAKEGPRSSENSKDVKEDQGALAVDSAASGATGGQDSVQMNIGTNQSATGEDSSVETASVKGGKDDPGSEHPARTDNDSLDNKKYASDILRVHEKIASLGTSIVAAIASEANGQIASRPNSASLQKAAAAGSDLAATVIGAGTVDKQAEAAEVVASIQATIEEAQNMAVKTAGYLHDYFTALKQAEDEAKEEDDKSNPSEGGDDDSASDDTASDDQSGAPVAGDSAGDAGTSDEDLLALLSGGQDMGGDSAAAGMAGPGGDAGAGDPMAGAGADPMAGAAGPGADPMAGGADPMAGGNPMAGADPMAGAAGPGADPMAGGAGGEDQMAMILQICQQLGISPEELQAAALSKQAEALVKVAKDGMPKSTKSWKPKTAAQLQRFKHTLKYVQELTGR